MGSQLVAQTTSGNYVVCNNTFAPNISGGFSISLWFSCSGQLNKTGTLISLPLNKTRNGLQIDISGTNMLYSGWNALPPTNGLVIYFTFDTNPTDTINSITPNTNSGSISTSTKKIGTGSLNITNGRINISNNTIGTLLSINNTNNTYMSSTFWVYPTSFPNGQYCMIWYMSKQTGSEYRQFYVTNTTGLGGAPSNSTIYFVVNDNNNALYTPLASNILNTWTHIGIVVSGTSCILYVNGVAISGSPFTIPNVASVLNTMNTIGFGSIAELDSDNYKFPCYLDDVRYYSRALTQSEITTIYNYI
jgi:hypothetical protein